MCHPDALAGESKRPLTGDDHAVLLAWAEAHEHGAPVLVHMARYPHCTHGTAECTTCWASVTLCTPEPRRC